MEGLKTGPSLESSEPKLESYRQAVAQQESRLQARTLKLGRWAKVRVAALSALSSLTLVAAGCDKSATQATSAEASSAPVAAAVESDDSSTVEGKEERVAVDESSLIPTLKKYIEVYRDTERNNFYAVLENELYILTPEALVTLQTEVNDTEKFVSTTVASQREEMVNGYKSILTEIIKAKGRNFTEVAEQEVKSDATLENWLGEGRVTSLSEDQTIVNLGGGQTFHLTSAQVAELIAYGQGPQYRTSKDTSLAVKMRLAQARKMVVEHKIRQIGKRLGFADLPKELQEQEIERMKAVQEMGN